MIKIGRIRFWFAKMRLRSRGFCGIEYVLRCYSLSDITKEDSGVWCTFTTWKGKQEVIKRARREGWGQNLFGFTTYWFWRFFLSIHTPSYYAENG